MKGEVAIVKEHRESEKYLAAYAVTNARRLHIASRNSLHYAVLSDCNDSIRTVIRRLPGLALETVRLTA
jgi:hypothetical protein